MCFSLVNLKLYREIFPNYSLVFKKLDLSIPLSTKVKIQLPHKMSGRNFYTVLGRQNIVTILIFRQFSQV